VAQCDAMAYLAPTPTRAWSCSATYDRADAGSKVNREMATQIPKNWTVTFTPLKGMRAAWSITQPVTSFKVAEVASVESHFVDTASRLQPLVPAFSKEVTLGFKPVDIPVPKRKDGTPYPPDPMATSLREASLSVAGPLRTIDALLERDVPADWRSIKLSFSPTSSTLSINSSAIAAEVTGVIYAKQ